MAEAGAADNARCPRCGATFHCGAREARCACAGVALDAPTQARLRVAFGAACLCVNCLRALQAEGAQQGPLP